VPVAPAAAAMPLPDGRGPAASKSRPGPGWGRRVVAFVVALAATSVASGLLRVAMFGAEGARTGSSATFLVLNVMTSFLVSFAAFALIGGHRSGRARPGLRLAVLVFVAAAAWASLPGAATAESPTPGPTFNFDKKFSQ